MLLNTVIVDLDGTLALNEDRQHFITGADKDWKAFNEACDKDTPNIPVIRLVRQMHNVGYKIVIFSGRENAGYVLRKTQTWLMKNKVQYDFLSLRTADDYRPDEIIKREMFSKYISNKDEVLFVLDDRNKVVKMWRELGLTCLQVAEGNF